MCSMGSQERVNLVSPYAASWLLSCPFAVGWNAKKALAGRVSSVLIFPALLIASNKSQLSASTHLRFCLL